MVGELRREMSGSAPEPRTPEALPPHSLEALPGGEV